jgi:RNA polymerase sigma-70 factor (ECF subfamily)
MTQVARDGASPPLGSSGATPTGETTIELVERAKTGDVNAREQLMSKCLPLLRRWARHKLPQYARDLADTEDIVQDTLLNAFRRLPTFKWEREGALYCFLREALRNRIIDEVRRAQRSPLPEALVNEPVDRGQSPFEALVDREKLERYEAALERLRPIDREAIIGRIELQLSFEELAVALGKPTTNAARVALSRAVASLIREMGQ